AMVFDVDRPEAATAWQDAPTECPRPNWVTQNPRNGHAHLGYVLASPVSRTLKARATPQRFLARIQHGLTMALDADRAYTHRLTKTPDHPT
ncbi:replication initiation protein, partial [Citrobacter freundii]